MAEAYAVVLADARLFDKQREDTIQRAQVAADQKFEAIAQANMKGTVTRNPEPRVMTYPELRNAYPHIDLDNLVGLYFTADIS